MSNIFVLAEHRQNQLREITFEMITKARSLAKNTGSTVNTILLGNNVKSMTDRLAEYSDQVILIENPLLEHYTSQIYQKVLNKLITNYNPLLTIIAHTTYGIDLAPSLATALQSPLATDCTELTFKNNELFVQREMYGGKVNVNIKVRFSPRYLVTVRQAVFPPKKSSLPGKVIQESFSFDGVAPTVRFIDYVLPPPSEIDITTAEVLVGIGRGVKDETVLSKVQSLAKTLDGHVACTRPIVDKGWLSTSRQIGSSGKTVKPKLYIALGISGAFQHVLGMKDSDLVIAVNKDRKAPIFNFADYGVVDDLTKVISSLTPKISEVKGKNLS